MVGGEQRGKKGGEAPDSLGGAKIYVDGSYMGKRGILFSGNLASRAVHLAMKAGHFLEVLLWVEVGLQEMQ